MFVKNLLKSGSFFIPVPVGMPLTLQYGVSGKLQRVYLGHDLGTASDCSKDFLSMFVATPIVPTDIPIKNTTTYVRGVLYTDTVYPMNGKLPECLYEIMTEDYTENPQQFKFFAATVENTAVKNPTSNMQWLHVAKFNALRGWIVPQDFNREKFDNLLKINHYPFRLGYISEYIVYEGNSYTYTMLDIDQYVVDKSEMYLNQSGWLRSKLYTKDADKSVSFADVEYSAIVRHAVGKDSIVVMYGNSIECCITRGDDVPSRIIKCPVCGKQYGVKPFGITQCDDPHCMSTQFNNVNHMLHVFNLPPIEWDIYKERVHAGKLLTPTDVFDLPEYMDATIDVKLSTIFAAIVPLTVVPDVKLFDVFCNKCNNDLKTVRYYMDNPDRIRSDIGIASAVTPRFVDWLTDPANLLMFDTVVDLPQIRISLKSKKFNGLPILRNQHIYLTGDFKHGMYRDVVSLLESFSATIYTEFTDKVNCVIIGGLHQNINGRVINEARKNNIPVFEEMTFFGMYKLDEDIKQNLGEE